MGRHSLQTSASIGGKKLTSKVELQIPPSVLVMIEIEVV
jgi:hypothetical protein